MSEVGSLKWYEFPAEVEALQARMDERDEARDPKVVAALDREIAEAWERLQGEIEAKAETLVRWLRVRQRAAEATKAEAERFAVLAARAQRQVKDLKNYILEGMGRIGVKRLEGPGWKLWAQRNGGAPPVIYEGDPDRLPLELRAPVLVDGAAVAEGLEEALTERGVALPEEFRELVAEVLWRGVPPQPNLGRARERLVAAPEVDEETGEIREPELDGFRLGDVGQHLRVG